MTFVAGQPDGRGGAAGGGRALATVDAHSRLVELLSIVCLRLIDRRAPIKGSTLPPYAFLRCMMV